MSQASMDDEISDLSSYSQIEDFDYDSSTDDEMADNDDLYDDYYERVSKNLGHRQDEEFCEVTPPPPGNLHDYLNNDDNDEDDELDDGNSQIEEALIQSLGMKIDGNGQVYNMPNPSPPVKEILTAITTIFVVLAAVYLTTIF